MPGDLQAATGHVFRVERARGPIWYAKYGCLTAAKSGKVRSVPMAPDVATVLAKLGDRGELVDATIWCFSATPVATLMARPCGGGTTPPSLGRACAGFGFTICTIPSVPG
jgi:hypothetical protein